MAYFVRLLIGSLIPRSSLCWGSYIADFVAQLSGTSLDLSGNWGIFVLLSRRWTGVSLRITVFFHCGEASHYLLPDFFMIVFERLGPYSFFCRGVCIRVITLYLSPNIQKLLVLYSLLLEERGID